MDFAKVHIYERMGGAETLVRTNLYKMFERRTDAKDKTSPLEAYFAQGGHWYDRAGNPIETADIPEWVWAECRAMLSVDRGMYRILLPEEIGAGATVPTFEDAPEFPPTITIMQALVALDPKNNAHWTKDGKPNPDAVSTLVGSRITSRRLAMAAPRFVRPA